MKLHDVEAHRVNKEHHMRYGHLTHDDRMQNHPLRYGFLDSEDKQYHSPERPKTMEGEY